eukprot:3940400-Rhodomonas_salina.2
MKLPVNLSCTLPVASHRRISMHTPLAWLAIAGPWQSKTRALPQLLRGSSAGPAVCRSEHARATAPSALHTPAQPAAAGGSAQVKQSRTKLLAACVAAPTGRGGWGCASRSRAAWRRSDARSLPPGCAAGTRVRQAYGRSTSNDSFPQGEGRVGSAGSSVHVTASDSDARIASTSPELFLRSTFASWRACRRMSRQLDSCREWLPIVTLRLRMHDAHLTESTSDCTIVVSTSISWQVSKRLCLHAIRLASTSPIAGAFALKHDAAKAEVAALRFDTCGQIKSQHRCQATRTR